MTSRVRLLVFGVVEITLRVAGSLGPFRVTKAISPGLNVANTVATARASSFGLPSGLSAICDKELVDIGAFLR